MMKNTLALGPLFLKPVAFIWKPINMRVYTIKNSFVIVIDLFNKTNQLI